MLFETTGKCRCTRVHRLQTFICPR